MHSSVPSVAAVYATLSESDRDTGMCDCPTILGHWTDKHQESHMLRAHCSEGQSFVSVSSLCPSSFEQLPPVCKLRCREHIDSIWLEPYVRVARLDCVDIIFKRCASFSSPNSSCRASTLVSSDPRLLWSLHGFVSSPFPLHGDRHVFYLLLVCFYAFSVQIQPHHCVLEIF